MEKRVWIFGLLLALMIGGVFAADAPDLGVSEEDVEEIERLVEDYSPLDEEGNINVSKYKPFKSKARERIDKINLWLEENASWLKVVFGMVPSITWLFAINLYLILLSLVILVFNGDITFGFFGYLSRKIDLMFFEASWANILGFVIFAILLVTKILVKAAVFIHDLFGIIWNKVLPIWGMAIAIILIILVGVGMVLLAIFAPQVLEAIRQAIKKRKEKKEAKKEAINREALEKTVEGITGE